MASYHHKPFATFALTGKGSRHGALVMRGDEVFSYDTKIAHVNRENKRVILVTRKFSRTTSMHQGAVRLGVTLHLASQGWYLTEFQPGTTFGA